MSVRKELWQQTIIEGLFPNNDFQSKAVNDDQYVNLGKTVHIPNAGVGPAVVKDRNTYPASAKMREDDEVVYDLHEYTTDPMHLPDADKVELSYDKRNSLIRVARNTLIKSVAEDMLLSWAPTGTGMTKIETSGAAVKAHTVGATGNRKSFVRGDILNIATQFDKDDIPNQGRYILLDAVMYNSLLNDLTESDKNMFMASANAATGVVGELYGISVMKRSRVLRYDGDNVTSWSTAGKATDVAAALAWHTDSVSRALGVVKAFDDTDNPLYYGDILSFLVRAGGCIRRKDKLGVIAVPEATAA